MARCYRSHFSKKCQLAQPYKQDFNQLGKEIQLKEWS